MGAIKTGAHTSNVVAIESTAIDDVKFRLIQNNLWFREGNFVIVTATANYGQDVAQSTSLIPGSTISFQDFNLGDIYFINATTGQNTTIQFVGILMTEQRMKELGVTNEAGA